LSHSFLFEFVKRSNVIRMADRISVPEERSRHMLADDCHPLRSLGILRPKGSPEIRGIRMTLKKSMPTTLCLTFTSRCSGIPGTLTRPFQLPSWKANAEKLAAFHATQRTHTLFNLLEHCRQPWIIAFVARRVAVNLKSIGLSAIKEISEDNGMLLHDHVKTK
jgi:hypothetical protein